MIIVRSPLRITLGGGGTDLPSYYQDHGGFLIAAAIDKYVYLTIHQTFVEDLIVKYSKMERVPNAEQLEHPIIRECFKLMELTGSYLEVSSSADIPAGTGLGSSGSFCTALLRALYQFRKLPITAGQLAQLACEVEINRLKEPVGKQDQYIAAYGGVTCFDFNRDESVDAKPLNCSDEALHNLEDNLLLFFTGYSRSASGILKDQDERSRKRDQQMIENMHYVKTLGLRSKTALESGNLHEFGNLMHEHWQFKCKRSASMSNGKIDEWYDIGVRNGAIGGKLVGAGGGGFLMFYTEDRMRLRRAMTELGLKEVRFRFDYEGSKVVVS
jgi:D-glycero-alpha-D-manno-heptose-7-phosphate kinase